MSSLLHDYNVFVRASRLKSLGHYSGPAGIKRIY
jgi:hypothetical protein